MKKDASQTAIKEFKSPAAIKNLLKPLEKWEIKPKRLEGGVPPF